MLHLGSVNVFLVLGPLSSIGTSEKVCKAWIGFQMAGVCILLSVLDYILMLRSASSSSFYEQALFIIL